MSFDFDSFIEQHFIDPNGVVYSQISLVDLMPLTDNFFQDKEKNDHCTWGADTFTASEFWNYENCGMCTGAYLNALCCALRTSGTDTPKNRALAKRTFDALQYIYHIGSQWEEGSFPKIWGNRLSHQTSTDQVLYAMHSMHNYFPFASAEDQEAISRMIPAMTDFWVRRKYTLTYYHRENMIWPPLRFPAFLMLAWKYSGKEEYRTAGLRIIDENIDKIPENSRRKSGALFAMADAVTMDVMNHEILLDYASVPDSYKKNLVEGLRFIWDEARQTLSEDGFYFSSMPCDPVTAQTYDPGKNGPRSAWSSMVVRAGLQIAHFIPELFRENKKAAELVLQKLSPSEMYYYHPDDAEKMPPQKRLETLFLSGDAITNRQWTFYLLKEMQSNNSYPKDIKGDKFGLSRKIKKTKMSS